MDTSAHRHVWLEHSRRILFLAGFLVVSSILPIQNLPASLPEAASSTRWLRLETPNFVCFTNADQAKVARILIDLERLSEILLNTTAGMAQRSHVPSYVMVFRDLDQFAPYNLRRGEDSGAIVGYFSAGSHVNYLAFGLPEHDSSRRILYHEFVHSLVHANLPNAPLWLNEGLAEYYSTFQYKGLSADVGKAIDEHYLWLQRNKPLALKDLILVDHSSPHYTHANRMGTFYAQCWALVHMLVSSEGGKNKLGQYLTKIGQGVDGVAAFESSFGLDSYVSLQGSLGAYVRQGKYSYQQYRLLRNFDEMTVKAYLMKRPEVLFRLGELQLIKQSPRISEAREHFLQALRIDASFAPALVGLGITATLSEEYTAADSLFQLAITRNPNDPSAYLHAGRNLLQEYFGEGNVSLSIWIKTPPNLRRAREYLLRALDLSPDLPNALVNLGRTYEFDWGDSVSTGLWAVQQASALMPGRVDLLVMQIALTANAGNRGAAVDLLNRRLVPLRQRGSLRSAGYSILRADRYYIKKLIEGGKREEAIALAHLSVETAVDPKVREAAEELLGSVQK